MRALAAKQWLLYSPAYFHSNFFLQTKKIKM